MKKKILIVSTNQFGYLSDYYYWCKYLRNDYDIQYLCFDRKLDKLVLENVDVVYVKIDNRKIKSHFELCKTAISICKNSSFNYVIIGQFFLFSFILPLLTRKCNLFYDIRTVAVDGNYISRYLHNLEMFINTLIYKKIIGISPFIQKFYKISSSKFVCLPLGADIFSTQNKDFRKLDLLYIGTLSNRNIIDTVIGFHKYSLYDDSASYTIIGGGSKHEEDEITNYILNNNLSDRIQYLGYLPHSIAKKYFTQCNVGVSYIPMIDYYDKQPPTKTYEYILSGLFCIATATSANRAIVSKTNGRLIEDNSDSFFLALKDVMTHNDLSSVEIRNSLINCSWSNIVSDFKNKYLI